MAVSVWNKVVNGVQNFFGGDVVEGILKEVKKQVKDKDKKKMIDKAIKAVDDATTTKKKKK